MLKVLKNKKGFTLVEVIVVAVIVAVLALVAIQLYQGYVREARQNTAENLAASAAAYLQTIVNAIDSTTADTDAGNGLTGGSSWTHNLPTSGQAVTFTCPVNATIPSSSGGSISATVNSVASGNYKYR